MKVFKALSKLINSILGEKKEVVVTENYSEVQYEELEEESDEQEEKTIIHNEEISSIVEWATNKIELLHEADRHRNADAILAEFDEWINIPNDSGELEYLCIENEDWTDEQEIDVQ